ncbi:hypothetical protein NSQ26_11075 [Bacillus sp. FSL W7-1360]
MGLRQDRMTPDMSKMIAAFEGLELTSSTIQPVAKAKMPNNIKQKAELSNIWQACVLL